MERNRKIMSTNLKFLVFLSTMMFQIQIYTSEMNRMAQFTSGHYHKEKATPEWLSPDSDEIRSWQDEEGDIGKMEDDLINGNLPGQPSGIKFNQYAGYVNVNKSKGRNLFYYFVEANNPTSKPLVLWLNGGPGASSLGFGAMIEQGPFGVNPDGQTLYTRPYAWNKVANMLYLESPAGIGFSYSNTTSDYQNPGDKRTAQDTYIFLLNWLKRFPHYKGRVFYITGESYGGYYVPELADVIIKGNKETASNSVIQLKGIMIGNGMMNDETDQKGQYDYYRSHVLISEHTHHGLIRNCFDKSTAKICRKFGKKIWEEMGKIDPYSIYTPLCPQHVPKIPRRGGYDYDPCESNYVSAYLNLPQVQKAFHANITKLSYPWKIESDDVNNNWKDSPSTMFPIYKRLISSGLRILLYSGDTDSVVPVTGTLYSIASMNRTVIRHWHTWSDGTQEMKGIPRDSIDMLVLYSYTRNAFLPKNFARLVRKFSRMTDSEGENSHGIVQCYSSLSALSRDARSLFEQSRAYLVLTSILISNREDIHSQVDTINPEMIPAKSMATT